MQRLDLPILQRFDESGDLWIGDRAQLVTDKSFINAGVLQRFLGLAGFR